MKIFWLRIIAMFAIIFSLVWVAIIGYAFGKNPIATEQSEVRQARFFPFYTIGRFANDVCTGSNGMLGTCVVRGECRDGGGVSTGSCNAMTTQAVCCVYQLGCGTSTSYNNTYFYNNGYPGPFTGGPRCGLTVTPFNEGICQLRIDFLSFSLAPPNGNGVCNTDFLTVTGGSSRVPRICGENTGQHLYVDFNGEASIVIAVETTGSYTFNRNWQFQVTQIACSSPFRAPSGCLQYHLDESGNVQSFNYGVSPNPLPNSIGMEGSRQIVNHRYGICVRMAANRCGITWGQIGSDAYSFTMTGDVGAVDPSLLGTADVQEQTCTTDYIIIPNPVQNGIMLAIDRFCGLGLVETTSNVKPFALFVVHDDNENFDIANRGFSLAYSQNQCPVA